MLRLLPVFQAGVPTAWIDPLVTATIVREAPVEGTDPVDCMKHTFCITVAPLECVAAVDPALPRSALVKQGTVPAHADGLVEVPP